MTPSCERSLHRCGWRSDTRESTSNQCSRHAISVRGLVQGVGFRPFVFHLAHRVGLSGFVRNQTSGVWIEVEGEPEQLDQFLAGLRGELPASARVDEITCQEIPCLGEAGFRIEVSDTGSGTVVIGPDLATCDACLSELFDPTNRRFRYPFLNCTHCGPRFTIIRGVPYDRERTTMARFAFCAACRAEFDDPTDRRFHAQPTACPACGPRLAVLDVTGRARTTSEPLADAVTILRAGGIVAVKGLGGYHLACDATQPEAVAELRRRKHRDEKPFAVMCADLSTAQDLAVVSDEEAALLTSVRRPIVLLRKRDEADLSPGIAPGNSSIGIMLAYTPLHHLLLNAVHHPLVMTSGNRSEEPIAFDDAVAITRLAGIADAFLTHDRPIYTRCDDSVSRWVAGSELPIRRSRGYAPQPLALPRSCRHPTLAVGGQLKSTFALAVGTNATISHHLGDLDNAEAFRAFTDAVSHYERLLRATPALIVHDMHPDYASTRYAHERLDVPRRLAVQHHHAHLASCLAENGMDEPTIGVIFDGAGYGTDGTIWGGEFLIGDCREFQRAGHFRTVGMPGGEQATREPWRMALAYLIDAGIEPTRLTGVVRSEALRTARQLIERRTLTPLTSSVGRLFDAIAAIIGVRHRVSYEGQAAIELEALAASIGPEVAYTYDLSAETHGTVIDCRPLIAGVVADACAGVGVAQIARRFHTTLVEIVSCVCRQIRNDSGLSLVALSGGVFQNALLTLEVATRLQGEGFRVLRHSQVPPGDGGLSLGQLAIAATLAT
ncbi:MAG: carbamoyltransferase HypF [Planctomycetaceae bacterium]|nr:carbamoyltransferase HypF [Planctomycetaceae bacterium]